MAARNYTQKVKTSTGYDMLFPKTTSEQVITDAERRFTSDTEINAKAPLDSPEFTGLPTAPTPPVADTSTLIATTEFVAEFLNLALGDLSLILETRLEGLS